MLLEWIEVNYFGEVVIRYCYIGSDEEIGIILLVIDFFCLLCMRVCIFVEGKLYICLFVFKGNDLRELFCFEYIDEDIIDVVCDIWNNREDCYLDECLNYINKKIIFKIEMLYIGG